MGMKTARESKTNHIRTFIYYSTIYSYEFYSEIVSIYK